MKPLITVAVPVNNTVRDLPTCINSLLTQTHTDFELLLLDDGSTDGSDALCREYLRRDSRIRFVPLRHKGVSATRNRALETARGEYIAFVDADDWVEPDYLARLSSAPFPSGDALVVCGMTIDHADGRSEPFLSYPDRTISRGGEYCSDEFIRHQLLRNGYATSKLFSLRTIREHGLRFCEELALMEDQLFLLHYLPHARTIVLRSGTPYHYVRCGCETLVTRKQAPTNMARLGALLLQYLQPAAESWGATDPHYLEPLHRELGLDRLLAAVSLADRTSYRKVYAAAARVRRVIETRCGRQPLRHPIVGRKLLRLIGCLPASLYGLPYAIIRLRHCIRRAKGRPVNY
ncbi:glycosyltransferase family 2 protein [Alistipes sp.]|uniref:glycosyltransferase family 2 protein n=1 Tax=Alistipes sp. TaxID=1872444 RepID=UPI003AEFB82B